MDAADNFESPVLALTYYHGSNTLYDFPSFEFVDNWTLEDPRPSKVVLGYYVTPDVMFAAQCGKYVYEVRMKLCEQFNWPYDDMVRFCYGVGGERGDDPTQKEQILHFRRSMARTFDMVNIVEHDGRVGECFIIDLDGVESFRLVDPSKIITKYRVDL